MYIKSKSRHMTVSIYVWCMMILMIIIIITIIMILIIFCMYISGNTYLRGSWLKYGFVWLFFFMFDVVVESLICPCNFTMLNYCLSSVSVMALYRKILYLLCMLWSKVVKNSRGAKIPRDINISIVVILALRWYLFVNIQSHIFSGKDKNSA